MKKMFIIIILVLFGTSFCPAHHDGDGKILNKVLEQSIRNYQLSVECRNLIDFK